VTLQDVTMILGLPINNIAVCEPMALARWRDNIGASVGIRPPDVGPNKKDKKPSDTYSSWLTTNFHTYPNDANDGVVQGYARALLWQNGRDSFQ
jgi:hypothetical protein